MPVFYIWFCSPILNLTPSWASSDCAQTPILAANDQMAYGARLALHRAGLRVPEDVSLIGFDDLPHSAFTLPPLTSVRQSVYEIGTSAAKAMFDLLNKTESPPRLVEAELVIRESTRIYRR